MQCPHQQVAVDNSHKGFVYHSGVILNPGFFSKPAKFKDNTGIWDSPASLNCFSNEPNIVCSPASPAVEKSATKRY